jgi:hypothetical protein
MEQLPMTLILTKKDGNLITKNKLDQLRLDAFLGNMVEGDKIEVTYEPVHSEVSYAQLSKLHKCIRVIASETGHPFADIKNIVKMRAGMYSIKPALKSFSALTKDEISQCINETILLSRELNINLEAY